MHQPGTTVGAFLDKDEHWTLTVNSTNPDAWPVIAATNQFNQPPEPGDVFFMANLTVHYEGGTSASLTDLTAFLNAAGNGGIGYRRGCGVLPHPTPGDYFGADFFPGATFGLNLCWPIHQPDAASLEMYWAIPSPPGPWWALH
jgi:hypothetical protein